MALSAGAVQTVPFKSTSDAKLVRPRPIMRTVDETNSRSGARPHAPRGGHLGEHPTSQALKHKSDRQPLCSSQGSRPAQVFGLNRLLCRADALRWLPTASTRHEERLWRTLSSIVRPHTFPNIRTRSACANGLDPRLKGEDDAGEVWPCHAKTLLMTPPLAL